MERLLRFTRNAEGFCATLEAAPELEPRTFARRARNDVAGAYLSAALLPGAAFTEAEIDLPEWRVGRYAAIEDAVRALLGSSDEFVDVFDPTEPDEPITRSLSQELVEIYEDLVVARTLLSAPGEPTAAALWEIEWAFENHWGKHAVDVLRPLHHLARR